MEQKVTVRLEQAQVTELKNFVRDQIRLRAGQPGPQPGELEKLRLRIAELATDLEELAEDARPEWSARVAYQRTGGWIKALLEPEQSEPDA